MPYVRRTRFATPLVPYRCTRFLSSVISPASSESSSADFSFCERTNMALIVTLVLIQFCFVHLYLLIRAPQSEVHAICLLCCTPYVIILVRFALLRRCFWNLRRLGWTWGGINVIGGHLTHKAQHTRGSFARVRALVVALHVSACLLVHESSFCFRVNVILKVTSASWCTNPCCGIRWFQLCFLLLRLHSRGPTRCDRDATCSEKPRNTPARTQRTRGQSHYAQRMIIPRKC